jgi:hypothetical protein
MKTGSTHPALVACLALLPFLTAVPSAAQENTRTKVRIGIFDSRAVALAYRNSDAHRESMKEMHEELARAKKTNDGEKVKQLMALGPSRQHLAHQQVFSNGSIVDIVPQFQGELPKIAAKNNVLLIVSKWELPYLGKDVETVDVTAEIVALFRPNEQTRKWLDGLKDQPPLPLQDLAYDPGH